MEQPPPSRSTPPPAAAPGGAVAPGAAPVDGVSEPAAGPIAPGVLVCPTCAEPRQEDARYCEECGHDFSGDTPPPPVEERRRLSGPTLWLVVLFWAVLAVGGLWFLYTALYAL